LFRIVFEPFSYTISFNKTNPRQTQVYSLINVFFFVASTEVVFQRAGTAARHPAQKSAAADTCVQGNAVFA